MTTICEKIRAARVAAGMTQKQLGLAVGFSENSAERMIQKWEYGKQAPSLQYLRPLSNALKVSLDYLVP
jgi:transcriptional regulator with XRE-family HTH domain